MARSALGLSISRIVTRMTPSCSLCISFTGACFTSLKMLLAQLRYNWNVIAACSYHQSCFFINPGIVNSTLYCHRLGLGTLTIEDIITATDSAMSAGKDGHIYAGDGTASLEGDACPFAVPLTIHTYIHMPKSDGSKHFGKLWQWHSVLVEKICGILSW